MKMKEVEMVMLRTTDKAYKVAKKILEKKGVKVRSPKKDQKVKVRVDYLKH